MCVQVLFWGVSVSDGMGESIMNSMPDAIEQAMNALIQSLQEEAQASQKMEGMENLWIARATDTTKEKALYI